MKKNNGNDISIIIISMILILIVSVNCGYFLGKIKKENLKLQNEIIELKNEIYGD